MDTHGYTDGQLTLTPYTSFFGSVRQCPIHASPVAGANSGGKCSIDTAMAIGKKLTTLKLEDASASKEDAWC